MALYHATVKIISRSAGGSAIASAAYRSACRIIDERTGVAHDYRDKGHVMHSEIMAPDGAPAWVFDCARLWNAVEQSEKRKDSQLARELELALPRELTREAGVELVRGFVREKCVDHGMVADYSIHEPLAGDGLDQPHAHIMLTMRRIDGAGFSKKKATEWNPEFGKADGKAYVADMSPLVNLREAWAEHVNRALERGEQARGLEPGTFGRVDHRSLEAQGIEREATLHLGPQATAMERAGIETRLGDHNREVLERGAELAALKQERAQVNAEIIDLQAERSRRRVAELDAEIPYMAPVAAELARVAAGQPGDGSPLAQRIDRLAQAGRHEVLPLDRLSGIAATFTAAAGRTSPPPPAPALVAAWKEIMAAQGHAAERLPGPSEVGPRFWELAAEHLKREATRHEQAEQTQVREALNMAAAAERQEGGALRDLFNVAAGNHPAIAQAVEKIETKRSQERHQDSQARGLLWLDQTVRGFERIGTKAADMLGSVAGKLAGMVCDLFSPTPQTRLLSPEEKAERHALETEIAASQERRDARDREQRERLASVMASLDYSRSQEQEQSLERTRTRPGPG